MLTAIDIGNKTIDIEKTACSFSYVAYINKNLREKPSFLMIYFRDCIR